MSHAPNTRRNRVKETQPTTVFYAESSPETVSADVINSEEKKEANLRMKQLKYSISRSKSVSTDDHLIYVPDEDGCIRILTVTAAVVEFFDARSPAPLPELSDAPKGRIGKHTAYLCLIVGYGGSKTAITYQHGSIYLSGCNQAIRVHGLKNTAAPLPVVDWQPLHDALDGGVVL